MPKRTPIKGEPDFTSLSDETLKRFLELAQQMIFAYQQCDEEKTRVMKEVWKQISDEYSDRLHVLAVDDLSKQTPEKDIPVVHKIKMVKRIKR